MRIALVSVAFLAVAVVLEAPIGAQTYLGPRPYLSRADSPLLLTKPTLDDMEDGSLDILGVSADTGSVYGPGALCDSVDGDDGVIDGSGQNGHSFFDPSGSVTFRFDDSVIGSFPTSAGVVWTDGGSGTDVYFEAFDAMAASLGTIGPVSIADGSVSGETAEDRFFGIADRQGISAIKIWNMYGGIEVDHVQYSVGALSLEVSDTLLSANDSLTMTLAGGKANGLGIFVVLGVNGSPVWVPVYTTTFDGAGEIALTTTVPSGLSGIEADLGGVGIAANGKARFSDVVTLTFN